MNSTNRAVNRLFIFTNGLILLLLGVATCALYLVPAIRIGWENSAPTVRQNVERVFEASPMLATGNSWIGAGVIAILTALVIALVAFILKQGHGRTSQLIRDYSTDHGVTVVDAALAEELLKNSLTGRPELVTADVSTFEVTGTPALSVSVTARRGVSPTTVAALVEDAVRALDSVLGREIPTLVQIGGGFRARARSAHRLQ